ncbi:hypothetical protein PoB_003543000 [Plakobranchus ocellatus]|uniref:Uncharacterized protein n=1 Tax=Plakobranchus ocellatus TaxID=259542 RepID=A0AAV4APX5_9GAST|nr:hypothetical protein PoB_003543000 [Plakobranchus ocellatus]
MTARIEHLKSSNLFFVAERFMCHIAVLQPITTVVISGIMAFLKACFGGRLEPEAESFLQISSKLLHHREAAGDPHIQDLRYIGRITITRNLISSFTFSFLISRLSTLRQEFIPPPHPSTTITSIPVLFGSVGGKMDNESALRSAGTLLSQVRVPPPTHWSDGGSVSLNST